VGRGTNGVTSVASGSPVLRSLSNGWLLLILLVYGVLLSLGSRTLTVFEDEASVISMASADAGHTIGLFWSGEGQHEHPPLYDLVLHAWMSFTDGSPAQLRLPTVVFFCVALWLIGATAELLWGRRLLAVLLGMAWPLGFFFGTPAYWSGLALLCVAGSTWAYFAWRQSGRRRFLAAFVLFGTALVYTNYMGFVFLAGLGLHLLLSRPSPRSLAEATGAGIVIALAFAPLIPVLFLQVQVGTRVGRPPLLLLGDGFYLGYALMVSESVAPWYWPAAFAIAGILALLAVAARTPQMYWLLGLLAIPYVSSILIGIMNNRRLSLFGPWLILFLTGLLAGTRFKRTAAVALLLVFGTGWAGILSGRWYATFRHIEPWEEVTSIALALAGPGDLIVSSHPSFYFYAGRQLGWTDRHGTTPLSVEHRSGRDFSGLNDWEQVISGRERVIYVRSAVNPADLALEQQMVDFLDQHFRLTFDRRYLADSASELKNRFVRNQPRWRIELRAYEARSPALNPPGDAQQIHSGTEHVPR
jgi:hypothetical protein